jgi:hypothetical protein
VSEPRAPLEHLAVRGIDLFEWAIRDARRWEQEHCSKGDEEYHIENQRGGTVGEEERAGHCSPPKAHCGAGLASTSSSTPSAAVSILTPSVLAFKEVPVDKVSSKSIQLQNTGSTVVFYRWIRMPDIEGKFIADVLGGEDQDVAGRPSPFFCLNARGCLLPGEEHSIIFSFRSIAVGMFWQDWKLLLTPSVASIEQHAGIDGVVRLTGAAITEDHSGLQRQRVRHEIGRDVNVEIVEELLRESIVAGVETPPRITELRRRQMVQFRERNRERDLIFTPEVYEGFANLFDRAEKVHLALTKRAAAGTSSEDEATLQLVGREDLEYAEEVSTGDSTARLRAALEHMLRTDGSGWNGSVEDVQSAIERLNSFIPPKEDGEREDEDDEDHDEDDGSNEDEDEDDSDESDTDANGRTTPGDVDPGTGSLLTSSRPAVNDDPSSIVRQIRDDLLSAYQALLLKANALPGPSLEASMREHVRTALSSIAQAFQEAEEEFTPSENVDPICRYDSSSEAAWTLVMDDGDKEEEDGAVGTIEIDKARARAVAASSGKSPDHRLAFRILASASAKSCLAKAASSFALDAYRLHGAAADARRRVRYGEGSPRSQVSEETLSSQADAGISTTTLDPLTGEFVTAENKRSTPDLFSVLQGVAMVRPEDAEHVSCAIVQLPAVEARGCSCALNSCDLKHLVRDIRQMQTCGSIVLVGHSPTAGDKKAALPPLSLQCLAEPISAALDGAPVTFCASAQEVLLQLQDAPDPDAAANIRAPLIMLCEGINCFGVLPPPPAEEPAPSDDEEECIVAPAWNGADTMALSSSLEPMTESALLDHHFGGVAHLVVLDDVRKASHWFLHRDFRPPVCSSRLRREANMAVRLHRHAGRILGIVGGAGLAKRLRLMDALLDLCNDIYIGGGAACPFLRARGMAVSGGCDENLEATDAAAGRILTRARGLGVHIHLPVDIIVGDEPPEPCPNEVEDDGEDEAWEYSGVTSEVRLEAESPPEGWVMLDIGPESAAQLATSVQSSDAVFWAGPLGAVEWSSFQSGSQTVAAALSAPLGDSLSTPEPPVALSGQSLCAWWGKNKEAEEYEDNSQRACHPSRDGFIAHILEGGTEDEHSCLSRFFSRIPLPGELLVEGEDEEEEEEEEEDDDDDDSDDES